MLSAPQVVFDSKKGQKFPVWKCVLAPLVGESVESSTTPEVLISALKKLGTLTTIYWAFILCGGYKF